MNKISFALTCIFAALLTFGFFTLIGCGKGSSGDSPSALNPVAPAAGGAVINGNKADLGRAYEGLDSVGLVVRVTNVPADTNLSATVLSTAGTRKTLRPASLPGEGLQLAYDGLDMFAVASFSKIVFSADLPPRAMVQVIDRNASSEVTGSIRANLFGYRRRLDVSGNGRVDTNDLALIQGWIQAGRTTDTSIVRLRALELYPALSGDPLFLPVVADDDLNGSGAIDSYDVALTMAWVQVGRVADATLVFNRAKEIFSAVTVAPGKFPGDPISIGVTNYTTINIGGGVQMSFAQIPSATFLLGDGSQMHTVNLSRAYNMGVTEVTQRQYQLVIGDNPSNFTGNPDRPVEMVSWFNALQFCNQLSLMMGRTQCYTASGSDWVFDYNANGFRLPTEAEWEFAARGNGQGTVFTFSASVDDYAWHSGNSGGATHDVAQKLPNAYGLYDMLGNVWEWTWDWYATYPSTTQTDPVGPTTATYRVLRGGSWLTVASNCRSAYRYSGDPAGASIYYGFRICCIGSLP